MLPIRNSIRILLLNEDNQILLMLAEDPKTYLKNSKPLDRFWFTIGGALKDNETDRQAAIRELFEETGLNHKDVEFGPTVWFGEYEIILNGVLTFLKQRFIVAKTKNKNVFLNKLDENEKKVIKKLRWFSLKDIINSKDVIFPILLPKYLPNILNGKYPKKPTKIQLAINT